MIYTNGSHKKSGSRLECLLVSPKGEKIIKVVILGFHASKNKVEYEVVIHALGIALEIIVQKA